ncbi:MAG: glycosyltransferase family 4 protein [Chloroflexia bacterium]
MRVAIDARLLYYRRAGIGQYTLRLVEALTRVAPQEHFLLLQDRRQTGRLLEAPNLRHVPIWTPSHHRWESVTLPLELTPLRLDLLHSPDFVLPERRRYAGVATVHDLAFLRFPRLVTPQAARYYGRVREAVRSAERVIAVSECTRRDLLELLDVPEEKVRVVHEAAGPSFFPQKMDLQERRTFRGRVLAPQQFILFVGTIEPRKNLTGLLRAFHRMQERYADLKPHPRLVIAGEEGWLSEEVFRLVNELRLAQEVAFIGSVPSADLVWLYRAARFFVFPSLYEGFGLPPLEAMACGTPVIASTAGALPEVVGDAGWLVPPEDTEGWAEVMARLWSDEAAREQLRVRGLERASRFSWEEAARSTLEVYREAVEVRRS